MNQENGTKLLPKYLTDTLEAAGIDVVFDTSVTRKDATIERKRESQYRSLVTTSQRANKRH